MSDVFRYLEGELPLLISVPHDGREIPDEIRARMTDRGIAIPDTDWHVARLYEFAGDMGANLLLANYSRYVVDLNGSADDGVLYTGQVVTGLCPEKTFAGESIYHEVGIEKIELQQRVRDCWQPYHDKIHLTLDAIRARHGYALLWDAHSIPSAVPRLFDGELPVLNVGSDSGRSCADTIEHAVTEISLSSSFSSVVNGRFKGGYITRNYGNPGNGIHALQLEVAQRAYMNETTLEFEIEKANVLRDTLRRMLNTFLGAANS